MARIKFLQEDFAGFRPDIQVKPYQLREDQITTPSEAIQTIRQGIALSKEVADAGVGMADFLTKTGVIGKQPTKEDLMNEAAKKRAEGARKIAEQQRGQIVAGREAQIAEEQQLQQEGQPDYSRSGMQKVQSIEGERKRLATQIVPDFKAGKITPEEFSKQLEFALGNNVISADEKKTIEAQFLSGKEATTKAAAAETAAAQEAQAKAQTVEQIKAGNQAAMAAQAKAEEEARAARQAYATAPQKNAAADEEAQLLELDKQDLQQRLQAGEQGPAVEELKNSIRNREEFITEVRKPNPDPQKLAELDAAIKQREAETQAKAQEGFTARQAAMAEAQKAEEARQAAAKAREEVAKGERAGISLSDKTSIKNIVATLPEAKARQYFLEAASIETRNRTSTEQELMDEIVNRFPDLRQEGGRGGVLRERSGTALQAADFRAKIDERKAAIQQNLNIDEEAKRKQIENIDKALAAYDADPATAEGAFKKAVEAINGISGKNKKKLQTIQDLKDAKEELETYLGGGVARKQELDQNEEARTAAFEKAAASFIASASELQQLNDKKVRAGKLTPDEAARAVQLKQYLDDNKQLQERLMSADVAKNPNIKQFVLEVAQGLNEKNVPIPETAQQRQANFNENLKSFDAEMQKVIRDAAIEGAKEIQTTYLDADQLRLLAVKAALSGNKQDAATVLGALYEGKVVGMQPSSFADWLSGDYKKRFNNEIFQTLFTRARGKSDEEIALALQNLELKNINTIRQVADTLSNLDKRAQDLKEKQETEADRKAKIAAEKRTAEAKATEAEFKSTDEYLQKEFDKLSGQADEALAKGKYGEQQQIARLKLSSAMASYYAGRNQAAMRVAQAGETAAALNAGGKNFDDYANDVGKMQGRDQANYDKYSQFEKYVEIGPDGKPKFNKTYQDEFGVGTDGEKEKQKKMNTAQKEAFMKRLAAVKEYYDRYGKGSVLTNEEKNNRDAVYGKVIGTTRTLATLLQGGKIKRDDKNAADKIGKVLEEQKKVQAIVDGLAAGKYKTETEKKDVLDKLDEAVKRAEDAVK